MIGYAVRVLPWRLAFANCVLVTALMSLVAAWPWVMWPLQGTSVGVIAGAVAWAMDERAATVVDTLPRSLRWRTAARALIVVPILSLWIATLMVTRDRIPAHFDLFLLQGAAAVSAALGVTVWRRTKGVPEPGRSFAAIALASAIAFALIRPLSHWIPLFPIWPTDNWPLSNALWLAVLAASLAALARDLACTP